MKIHHVTNRKCGRFVLPRWLGVVLVGVFLLTATLAYGQTPLVQRADSLYAALHQQPHSTEMVDGMIALSKTLMQLDRDSARQYARAATQLAKDLNYIGGLTEGYFLMGHYFDAHGIYDSALIFYVNALKLEVDRHNNAGQVRILNCLTVMYGELGEPAMALDYGRQAYVLEMVLGDTLGAAVALTRMATQYLDLSEIDSARHFYLESQNLLQSMGNRPKMAHNYEGLGKLLISKGEPKEAITLLEKAMMQWEVENNRLRQGYTSLLLGQANLDKGEMELARKYFHRAEELAVPIQAEALLVEVYGALSEWYQINKQYPESLRYLQLHNKYHQEVFDKEKARQLAVMEALYDLNRKDKQYNLLNLDLTNTQEKNDALLLLRNMLFIAVAVLIAVLLILLRNYLRSKRTNRVLEMKREEIKRKNLEIVHQKYKALRASKAKSKFLAMMSHEIRTPMNAVIGITNLLLQENPRPDQEESLQTMKFSAESLLVLINDILDYNKIEAGKIDFEFIPFDLQSLLQSLRNAMRGKAEEKGLKLVYDLDDQLPENVVGDPTRLAQILNNLLSNAIKFTENGSVRLKVELVGETENKFHLNFSVTDTGIGISKEKLGTIFESFTQASSDITRRYGGTGLGLSITKKLVELQGSRIRVESEPGEGTRFFFNLSFDRATAKQAEALKQVPIRVERDLKGVQVLIAEDNQVNELVARRFLNKWGVEVDAVADGQAAVEQVQKKMYDLVLMDLQMPVMDGFKATRKIRNLAANQFRALPIIALTASAMNEIRHRAFEAGVTDFVAKPFNPDELRAVLEKYVLRDDHELIGQEF